MRTIKKISLDDNSLNHLLSIVTAHRLFESQIRENVEKALELTVAPSISCESFATCLEDAIILFNESDMGGDEEKAQIRRIIELSDDVTEMCNWFLQSQIPKDSFEYSLFIRRIAEIIFRN